jgi:uncharacterized protein YceH (UPF0502 family)
VKTTKGVITVDVILNEVEARVIGSLIEKKLTTPDYYPLTLNALTNACNQISNRDPVVSYDEQTVLRALDALREKKLAYVFHGSESRVPKYGHLFAEAFDLAPPEVAVLCVLLLRGAQTPGEVRGRTGRLHEFASLSEVETTLHELSIKEPRPLVVKLPRQTGSRESRYAHLLSGEVEIPESEVSPRPASASKARGDDERIIRLEEEVRSLRQELTEMRDQWLTFKRQFE